MAKRLSSDLPDPFENDDLFDDPLDAPLSDLDSLKIDDIDEDLRDPESAKWQPDKARAPRSVGRIIGSIFQIILMAAGALVLFLGIAFLLVYGGQQLGILPARAVPGATQIAALPTQAAAQPPTSAPETTSGDTTAVPEVLPTSTPSGDCPTAPAWWNSQQIQDNYTYFTQQALEEARTTTNISALAEQMRIRRSFVANYQAFDCVSIARDPLLRAFDATIDAARALNANDSAAFAQQQANVNTALTELTVALWALSANADPTAPAALGIARDSGAACGAQEWYTAVKPNVDAFYAAANQIDPLTTPASSARTLLDTMSAERANAAAVAMPLCAVQAQSALLSSLDNTVRSLEERLSGGSNPSAAEAARQTIRFSAWLRWLGVS